MSFEGGGRERERERERSTNQREQIHSVDMVGNALRPTRSWRFQRVGEVACESKRVELVSQCDADAHNIVNTDGGGTHVG